MPKIIEYFGLVLYFYSNEHLLIHVHVSFAEYESVFELFFENGTLSEIQTRNAHGIAPLPAKHLKDAKKLVETHAFFIADAWRDYFILNKTTKIKKITQKL